MHTWGQVNMLSEFIVCTSSTSTDLIPAADIRVHIKLHEQHKH